ncbi:hypothetical protein ACTWWB_004453 [Vibrio fluvialis]
MDITAYLAELNSKSQAIFKESLQNKQSLGDFHHLASCIYELSETLNDPQEKGILTKVSIQLESANLNLVLGLYRQAFTSLRLAFEMGLAAAYFSANKLELNEWLDGRTDIKWSKLIDDESGVLSQRYSKAFFSECDSHMAGYRSKARKTYRSLSEYVHGNNETWNDGITIDYNQCLFDFYSNKYSEVCDIILFTLICRYAKSMSESERESLQFITEQYNHISGIRELFGRA